MLIEAYPSMGKAEVPETLIRTGWDVGNKNVGRAINIAWVNLGYAQKKRPQPSLVPLPDVVALRATCRLAQLTTHQFSGSRVLETTGENRAALTKTTRHSPRVPCSMGRGLMRDLVHRPREKREKTKSLGQAGAYPPVSSLVIVPWS